MSAPAGTALIPYFALDREFEALEVLVAIDVEITDLARDGSAERAGQGADRQVDPGDLDLVNRAPPHSMQRAQRKRRPGLDPVVHRIPIQRLGRRNPRGSSYIHKCPAPRIPQAVRGSS